MRRPASYGEADCTLCSTYSMAQVETIQQSKILGRRLATTDAEWLGALRSFGDEDPFLHRSVPGIGHAYSGLVSKLHCLHGPDIKPGRLVSPAAESQSERQYSHSGQPVIDLLICHETCACCLSSRVFTKLEIVAG